MSEQTETKTATKTTVQIPNYGWNITNEQIMELFPDKFKNKESVVFVVAKGEVFTASNGQEMVPLILAQKAVVHSGSTQSSAAGFFLSWDNSRILKTIQNATVNVANQFEIGSALPKNFNLELHRSLNPLYEGQEVKVINPSTGEELYYYQNTVVVDGPANHDPVPEIPTTELPG